MRTVSKLAVEPILLCNGYRGLFSREGKAAGMWAELYC
jgi:hypothetical protein